jgi:hypothetical protein
VPVGAIEFAPASRLAGIATGADGLVIDVFTQATVRAFPSIENLVRLGMHHASVAPDSAERLFTIDDLLPGTYFLSALISRIPTAIVKSIVVGGRDVTDRPFAVSPGMDVKDVVVTFTEKSSSIAGAVTDGRGGEAADTVVLYFPVDRTLWSAAASSDMPRRIGSTTVQFGRYALSRLPAGEYYLVALPASDGSRWRDETFLGGAAAVATKANLGWGQKLVQNLRVPTGSSTK